MTQRRKAHPLSVYTIPAGKNFACEMVRHFLHQYEDKPEEMGKVTVLLPTRRACRSFQDMFLRQSKGRPLLLPKIQPLGDVDEQDLSLSLAGTQAMAEILALPPAISPLQRRIILARLIAPSHNFSASFDQALALADALAVFMDQIIIERLDFAALAHIVPEEFANHWQITLDFLKILADQWPAVLNEMGVIEAAERRNSLMHILGQHWQNTRPENPIYAAGSTGSIPATAELMKIIAGLPNGHIVLPGLDMHMDTLSWDALEPSHPQYGLKHLLEHLNLPRSDVKLWPLQDGNYNDTVRAALGREMMRPAATTQAWITLRERPATSERLIEGLDNLSLIEANNQREESLAIALEFKQLLETPDQTAVLVTPDRKLARRVSNHCKRWGITVDDSAGQSLNQSALGIYLKLLGEAAHSNLSPLSLLELLKHDLCQAGLAHAHYHNMVCALERLALRGLKPAPGFNGLISRLQAVDARHTEKAGEVNAFLAHLEPLMTPFVTAMNSAHPVPFAKLLRMHLALAEGLAATPDETGESRLWNREAGESAATLFAELSLYADHFAEMDGNTYKRVINYFLSGLAVRPRYGTHPRLSILGQLEARLIDADLIILGSLNEGSWPPDPGHDPWMSRPMRQSFGLPDPDRAIGLAAHDFIQGFCSPRVILTRAKTVDGTTSVPARWLQRLDTVIKAAGFDPAIYRPTQFKSWIEALDKTHDDIKPITRPSYAPPLQFRPKKLSVTKIDTWLKDPYAIYAREILKLRKLDDIEKPVDAAEMGTLLHAVLDQFISAHKGRLPTDAKQILTQHARDYIDTLHEDPALWSFWWPRFDKICDWFITQEREWRDDHKGRPLALEAAGEMHISAGEGSLILTGKVDRIDLLPSGNCAIIDYKSGGTFTVSKIEKGEYPQLPLEALMLDHNAFATYGIHGKNTASLHYWVLNGSGDGGKITNIDDATLKSGMNTLLDVTCSGLENLIAAYANENTPYICLPKAHAQPRFNDYAHFERIQEWAALEDEEETGDFDTGGAYG